MVNLFGVLTSVCSARRSERGSEPTATNRHRSHLPSLPPLAVTYSGVPLTTRLSEADIDAGDSDDLFDSPVLGDTAFARAVHGWVGYWTGPAAEWFPGFLQRMAWFGPTVDSALADAELPPSLRYLPLIESGYDPRVTSRARAVGLWQLMPSTAGDLGLEVTDVLDERRHVEKSTDAAIRFLDRLHDDLGLSLIHISEPTRLRRKSRMPSSA